MLQRASTQPRPRLFSEANQRTRCSGRRRTSTSCRIHTCCDRWRAYTSAARGGSRRAGTWQSRQARTTHRDPTVGPKGRWQQLYSRQHQKSAQHSNRKPKAETPTMRCQRRQSVPKTAARTNVAKACGFGHRSGKGQTYVHSSGCTAAASICASTGSTPSNRSVYGCSAHKSALYLTAAVPTITWVLQPAKWVVAAAGRTIRCRG